MSGLPLSDWRSKAKHTADECGLDVCPSCGCCCHGKPRASGCPMDDAPYGSIWRLRVQPGLRMRGPVMTPAERARGVAALVLVVVAFFLLASQR